MALVGTTIDFSGQSFGRMVRENSLLVDKTLFIQKFLEGETSSLIARPPQFGKTVNMSMLHHFFSASVDGESTKGLFDRFAIAEVDNGAFLKAHQGQYPVIFITFKDMKESSDERMVEQLRSLIQELYQKHRDILASPNISEYDKEEFEAYCQGTTNEQALGESLQSLCRFLYDVHRKRAIVLIDDFDVPSVSAYEHGYSDQLIQNLFSSALKGNGYLEKGLMMGTLRISKNSIFSGLNNLSIHTVLNRCYGPHFGFTESEVIELIEYFDRVETLEAIQSFYGGYQIRQSEVYHPCSLLHYMQDGFLKPYGIRSSNDRLLERLLRTSAPWMRKMLNQLMMGEAIEVSINDNPCYEDLVQPNSEALWTLLMYCGYVSASAIGFDGLREMCMIRIPNQEVLAQYQRILS